MDATHAWITTGYWILLRTSDGGTTWQQVTLPYDQSLSSVVFTSALNGAAVGYNTTYTSSDGGATWKSEFVGQNTTWRVNYLVCRLDGYQTPALANGLPVDIKRMIDDGANPNKSGRFVLDQTSSGDGNGWAAQAAQTLNGMKQAGASGIEEVLLDATPTYLTNQKRVMGYCSWGSNDPGSHDDTLWAIPGNQWQKGSLSTTYVSTSARTMNYPPDYANCQISLCCPSDSTLAGKFCVGGCWKGWYGVFHNGENGQEQTVASVDGLIMFLLDHQITNGYVVLHNPDGSEISRLDASADHPFIPMQSYGVGKQSLIVDLLHEGCDASIGNVTEPYLQGCGQPQYLFPRYVEGFPWAECAYMSMEWGGWREVAVGDPLMTPFAKPLHVVLTAPSSNTVLGDRNCLVSATVSSQDHLPIQRVEFWISNGKDIDALVGVATAAPYRVTFSPMKLPAPYNRVLPPGSYTIEAVAYADTKVREIGKGSCRVLVHHVMGRIDKTSR